MRKRMDSKAIDANATAEQRKALAQQMGHSTSTQVLTYSAYSATLHPHLLAATPTADAAPASGSTVAPEPIGISIGTSTGDHDDTLATIPPPASASIILHAEITQLKATLQERDEEIAKWEEFIALKLALKAKNEKIQQLMRQAETL